VPESADYVGITIAAGGAGGYAWKLGFYQNDSVSRNFYFQCRYIQASPPYDMGNGEIPLFVFLALNRNGDVLGVDVAPDPPWANNGPTDIRPAYYRNGKPMQQRPINLFKKPGKDAPKKEIAQYLEWLRDPMKYEDCEITKEYKNSDMALLPHPFIKPTDRIFAMVDPCSPISERLLELHNAGESICGLVSDGYLQFDNTPLDCKSPPGVMALPIKWRATA